MAHIADIPLGRYVPVASPLHALDPRLKLAGVPLLIIAAFSGGGAPERLIVLGGLALLLAAASRVGTRIYAQGIWALRWFFLFSLLLHLFLTPGRTLWGVPWLSWDGLLQGGIVCAQLGLAILFSSVLTLTTSPREIAAAFADLFAPLERLGLRVRESASALLLILHFIPILKEETAAALSRENESEAAPGCRGQDGRIRLWLRIIAPLVLRLADRADELARSLARGKPVVEDPVPLGPLDRSSDRWALVAGLSSLILVYSL